MNEDFSFFEKPVVSPKKSHKDPVLRVEDLSPWNPPNEHSWDNATPKHWVSVLNTVIKAVRPEDGWSEEKRKRIQAQTLCTAALREEPFWNENIQASGEFLRTLEAAIVGAQVHAEYFDSDFERHIHSALSQSQSNKEISPLLRRKITSILHIHFTPGECETFGREQSSQWNQYYPPATPRTKVVPIAPDRLGVFDALNRMTGIINPAEVGIRPLSADPLLIRPDIADDVAFTFDIGLREQLSEDFGFPLEHLTLREQISLIGTFRSITTEEEKRIVSTVKTFGLDGARAFLSTEFGDGFRGTVLGIAEKFSEDDAKQIFKSFSEIVTFAQETAETLGARFFANDKAYNADAVRTELLSRAKDLLLTAESSDASSIAAKLERFKSDIVLFASMFKVTQKGTNVKFEDIKGVRLESLQSDELIEEDRILMERILTENWQKQAPELLQSTLESLQESFLNPRSQFFILRKGNDIAASVRFDKQDDGSLYAGSLNVNDVYRSAGIGEAMLQSTIDTLAKTHVITAHVPAHLPVAMRYVNDFGLKIVGIDEEVLSDGTIARDLKLERNDAHNRQYGAHPHMERFDLTRGDAAIVEMVQYQASRGQVGTQFISDPLNPHLRFIAFEPAIVVRPTSTAEERQAA